ncbi:hypothetical protein G7Y89_g12291 [Cudoniella acicularis]|uniref:FAD-binding FR-type domain-containing protein n=1 Tax=Cudoniella acicularis TaxID=354080 RepID=A0A8H4VZT3_9HELO|nr:hypothetical protein G7Y89_g12291 [Cudoniella acicularis]
MHEWLGSIVMAEGLVHVAAALSSQHVNIYNTSGVAKLVAAAVGAVLLFSSMAYRVEGSLEGADSILIRRNLPPDSHRCPPTKERDTPVSDAVYIHVRLSRPWRPRAGQYVYLSILEKRKGFTQDLFRHTTNDVDQRNGIRAIIEGPYRKELDLKSYGTILLFATGIRIAGQLPYITQLLEEYHNSGEKNRRIALFVLDNYISNQTEQEDVARLRTRIKMTYDGINAETLIRSEIKGREGRTVVSLYTNNETSNKIRVIVRQIRDKTIDLKELEYRPYSA